MQGATQQQLAVGAGITRQAMVLRRGALGIVWALILVGRAAAFDTSCGTLPAWSPTAAKQVPAVVAIRTTGQATGTYETWQDKRQQHQLGHGDFTITGRGVVVGQLVVTAAHVVYPAKVKIALDQYNIRISPVVTVQQTTVSIGSLTGEGSVPAEIVHLNHRADLAILRPEDPTLLDALPFPTASTWWHEQPGEVSSLLGAGDCVITLVPERDDHYVPQLESEARPGKVVASSAVSSSSSVVAGLNPHTVTISTLVYPGDSGSPVVAFDMGTPRLVGIVSATRYPIEAKSYISRIDPILPILEALQGFLQAEAHIAQAE